MSSKAQKKHGYPLPENEFEEETASYCITIPAGYEYYNALRYQLIEVGKWWKWKRDADRPTAASDTATTWRKLLSIEENCGGLDMATQEDIAKGMYQAFNWIALQIATGSYQNVALNTDAEGVVTLPSGDGLDATLPEDDPLTPIDETESSRYGAMVEIAAKLELVLDKIDAYFGVPSGAVTPVTPEADAMAAMVAYFDCDIAIMETAVINYYAWRLAGATQIGFNGGATFAQYLFCNGYDYTYLAHYIIDLSGYIISKQQIVLKFWESLGDKFFSDYFSKGAAKPSSQYLDAACVPMPYQEYLDVPYASSRTLFPTTAKSGHRLLITVSGYYEDPDGDLQDPFWYRTAAGVLTRSNFQFVHSAGSNMPSDSQVPYNSSHVYQYTIDLAVANSSWSVNFPKNGGMAAGSTSPTNGFSIKITDVGLAVSQ